MTGDSDRYRRWAEQYDELSDQESWRGPEVLFGLLYARLEPGQTVLDLGIGTGRGSILLHRAGLEVTGVDNSPSMLEVCRAKGFADRLVEHDLATTPWPFDDGSFDHAISVGTLHFFGDLDPVFGEVARLIEAGGHFCFDYHIYSDARPLGFSQLEEGVYFLDEPEYGHRIFRHTEAYVRGALRRAGFEWRSAVEFVSESGERYHFRAVDARRS